MMADTNRFNKDTGLPPLEQTAQGKPKLRNARRQLRFSKFGVVVAWEEEPFEWVEPSRFGVVRRYSKGPIKEMRVLVELAEAGSGGTRLVYQVWAKPRNLLGWIAIPLQIGIFSARSFATVFKQYDNTASGDQERRFELPKLPVQFAAGGHKRLEVLQESLIEQGVTEQVLRPLVETIEQEDDLTVSRMRPYALADTWGVERRKVLELCLLSTRLGMLEFEWDLLCPLCRGAKVRSPSLGGIEPQVHCDTCNIDFDVNFERSVELTFHPNPSIRQNIGSDFCVAGPRVTPHVVVQQLLDRGEDREVTLAWEPGRYRVRVMERLGGQYVQVAEDGQKEWTLRLTDGVDWPSEEPRLAPATQIRLENTTSEEQLFILERLSWTDQAATAAEVTALQRFRDLFAGEALRPGERFSVGSMTILFTDLCGSTQMYNEVGDAPAFGLVMNHFDLLINEIEAEEGALVKTIGDAVMAVFRRPVGAVRAMVKAHRALAAAEGALADLSLKTGMHFGPCIAVTLNDKLDYFGSTVNIASRLEHLSEGGDIVMSTAVKEDPEVADFLRSDMLSIESVNANLKGYEEQFELARILLANQPKKPGMAQNPAP